MAKDLRSPEDEGAGSVNGWKESNTPRTSQKIHGLGEQNWESQITRQEPRSETTGTGDQRQELMVKSNNPLGTNLIPPRTEESGW